jgi:hypothetical protein
LQSCTNFYFFVVRKKEFFDLLEVQRNQWLLFYLGLRHILNQILIRLGLGVVIWESVIEFSLHRLYFLLERVFHVPSFLLQILEEHVNEGGLLHIDAVFDFDFVCVLDQKLVVLLNFFGDMHNWNFTDRRIDLQCIQSVQKFSGNVKDISGEQSPFALALYKRLLSVLLSVFQNDQLLLNHC